MNTMKMPGFTAEASLYKPTKRYYIAASGSAAAVQVVPQQLERAAALAVPPWIERFCNTVCRNCWVFGDDRSCRICYWCLTGPVNAPL